MNSIVAAILSLIIPGLGQLIQGESKKGIIFIVIYAIILIAWYMLGQMGIIGLICFIYAIYTAYDSYKLAKSKKDVKV